MNEHQASGSENVPAFYIDSIQFNFSAYTVTFRCGIQRQDPQHPENQQHESLVTLYMSPQHAKALHQTLGTSLSRYEERIGPIPLPAFEQEQPEEEQDE
jgi:hypothetical protein